ncbi:MAG TPA: YCF48-related protein [Bacteroidales bacterium]|nr:YCF48-related protein [Bacteroidales bacterium]
MNKFIFIGILSIILAVQLHSQTPWIRISPNPIESSLKEITKIPGTDRLMAIGSGASLLYTDDMGENWHVSYQPAGISRFITFNAIHFVDSNIGYLAGTKSTLLKTLDGGMTWQDVSPQGDNDLFDVYFHDELRGIITKGSTLLKTDDGCQTWDTIPIGISYNPRHLHFVNDSLGFLGNTNNSNYYKTDDAGNTWSLINLSQIITDFKAKAVNFINENIGFISGYIYISGTYEYFILKTFDGGLNWSIVYSDPFIDIKEIYFYDNDIGFAVGPRIMNDNIIVKTINGGDTWQNGIMNDYSIRDLNSFAYSNEGVALCVGDYGQIFTSIDVGENWDRTNETVCEGRINVAQIVNDSVVYIGTTPHGGGGVPSGAIYKSKDAGYTWNRVFRHIPFISICFLNELSGFTCGPAYGNVYKTINGGSTWQTLEVNTYNFDPYCVYFLNEQVGFVSGEENWAEIFKTTDGGLSWYKTDSYSHQIFSKITCLEFTDDSVGFAVGEYYPTEALLLRTIDQGETWTTDSLGFPFALKKIHFINPDIGFLLTYYNVILKTIDGGANWYEVPSGVTGYPIFNDIDFPTDNIGYITLTNNEIQIIKTTDGGESWFPIDFPSTATPTTIDFFNVDEGLIMGGGGIIFKTYTGGIVDVPEFPEDITKDAGLFCYPNPAKDILNIVLKLENEKYPDLIIVYDNFGRIIKKIENLSKHKMIELDISDWKNGVYFIISITNGKPDRRGKFVKVE